MAQTSVAQFASSLKMQVGTLIEQLKRAGVEKRQADDQLTEQDKAKLLEPDGPVFGRWLDAASMRQLLLVRAAGSGSDRR